MTSKITAQQIMTANGRYPERLKHKDAAQALVNAEVLAKEINLLCELTDYDGPLDCTSGFRPPDVNSKTKGAAKGSYHQMAIAADLSPELGLHIRKLGKRGSDALRKCHLFMEALESTPKWTHLDRGTRADRPTREFKP